MVTPEYRACAIRMICVLDAIDHLICFRKEGPPREWLAVGLALGLNSTRGRTETAVADERRETRDRSNIKDHAAHSRRTMHRYLTCPYPPDKSVPTM